MKTIKFFHYAIIILGLSIFSFSSCIDPIETPEVDHFKVMTDYMKANSMDVE
jgi:hypothetical protein